MASEIKVAEPQISQVANPSDREDLRAELVSLDFDPTALERQVHYTRDLAKQVRILRKRVEDSQQATEHARSQNDREHSALSTLKDKMFHRKSQDMGKHDSAAQNYAQSVQQSHQMQQELQSLEELKHEADSELSRMLAVKDAQNQILSGLDAIYAMKIARASDGVKQKNIELERAWKAAEDKRDDAQDRADTEKAVMDYLRKANTDYKSAVAPFGDTLAQSQWEGWTMTGGGRFSDDDQHFNQILGIIRKADQCVEAARTAQPKVQIQPVNIDLEGTYENHTFRRLMSDSAFLNKMQAAVTQIGQSEKIIRADIDRSYQRKLDAETDVITFEKEISLARRKLADDREALIAGSS